MWRLWAKALGTKEGLSKREADAIAIMRTTIVLIQTLCAIAIMANIIHKW